jgi:hypothetical protein
VFKRLLTFKVSFETSTGGERGIRTPGPVTVNSFQDCRIRPLCHFSSMLQSFADCECKYKTLFRFSKLFLSFFTDYFKLIFKCFIISIYFKNIFKLNNVINLKLVLAFCSHQLQQTKKFLKLPFHEVPNTSVP